MLEMKLNTTAPMGAVGCDPINVFPYQKTRQLRDRRLILNGAAPEAESEKLWFSNFLAFGLRFFSIAVCFATRTQKLW